jgi:Family of unknown function (DUF6481)
MAMSGFKEANFGDRLSEAAKARKAAMEKFRVRPDPNDPAVLERQRERQAVLEARAERDERREKERLIAQEQERVAQAAREQAEREAQAAREEAEKLAAVEREIEYERKIAEEAELEATKKAERDARYAARKARKKSGGRL